jgi:hypothetical protein
MQVDNTVSAVTRSDSDKVQSPEPTLLAIVQKSGGGGGSPALDRSRMNEIRGKILSGAYHSLATAEEVARHILQSGDLVIQSVL